MMKEVGKEIRDALDRQTLVLTSILEALQGDNLKIWYV